MTTQPNLPGFGAASEFFVPETIADPDHKLTGYTLLLAILPSPDEALSVTSVATEMKRQHGLGDEVRPADVLHISLHKLSSIVPVVPQAFIDAAIVACGRVVCPRFSVVFDRVCAYANGRKEHAVFLRCDREGDLVVAQLRNELGRCLRSVGVYHKPSGAPHVTLLYDHHLNMEQAVTPIKWNVTSFALVLSFHGLSHYQRIAEWPLA